MELIETIAGTAYLASDCRACGGDGESHDATNADNATGTVDPTGKVRCSRCSGKGKTYRAMWAIEIEAHAENDRRDRAATTEVGEMPDWMFA